MRSGTTKDTKSTKSELDEVSNGVIGCGYGSYIAVENQRIVELGSIAEILGIHEAKLMTYIESFVVK